MKILIDTKVMADVGAIGKNGVNTYDDYKFQINRRCIQWAFSCSGKNGVFLFQRLLSLSNSSLRHRRELRKLKLSKNKIHILCR